MDTFKLFVIYLLLVTVIAFTGYFLLSKITFPSVEKFNIFISRWLLGKIKGKEQLVLLIVEIFLLVGNGLYIFYMISLLFEVLTEQDKIQIAMFSIIYAIATLIFTRIILDLKSALDKYYSIIESLTYKLKKDSYLNNRLSILFSRTSVSFIMHSILFYVILTFVVEVGNLSYYIGYLTLLLMPIFLVTFIYITDFNEESQSLRRVLVYVLLLVITFWKSFDKFRELVDLDGSNEVSDFAIYIVLTVFIALDRLFKSVIDDFKMYKSKGNNS